MEKQISLDQNLGRNLSSQTLDLLNSEQLGQLYALKQEVSKPPSHQEL